VVSLESEFDQAMLGIYREAKVEEGYIASFFLQMVYDLGGLAAAKQLINSTTPSEGFTRLWELGRLDLTVESVALEPRWKTLFTPEELRRARQRLDQYRNM